MNISDYKKLKVYELKRILTAREIQIEFKGLKKDDLIKKCIESHPDSHADSGASGTDFQSISGTSAADNSDATQAVNENVKIEFGEINNKNGSLERTESTSSQLEEPADVNVNSDVLSNEKGPQSPVIKSDVLLEQPEQITLSVAADNTQASREAAAPVHAQLVMTNEVVDNEQVGSDSIAAIPADSQSAEAGAVDAGASVGAVVSLMEDGEVEDGESPDTPGNEAVKVESAGKEVKETGGGDKYVGRKLGEEGEIMDTEGAVSDSTGSKETLVVPVGPHTSDTEPMESQNQEKPSAVIIEETEQTTGGIFSMLAGEAIVNKKLERRLIIPEDAPKPKREWKYDAEPIIMESTAWVTSDEVQLDRYHCDLNMVIKNNGFSCHPLSRIGFGYMWAGARANYGVSSPCSVTFQVKITGDQPINIKEQPFGSNFMARVGWSIASTSYQLGESPYSFGYQSNGKSCCDSQFVEYGESYGIGDVITSYLQITDTMLIISFSKNDEPVRQAYQLESHLLGLNSLFPHIALKNLTVDINFGSLTKPWYPINREFTWLHRLPLDCKDCAVKPPQTKLDCEVLLMVGMMGAGKSYWVAQTVASEPERNWNVIGTPELLSRMKVDGQEVTKCYTGRWDDLFDKTNTCLKKLLRIAGSRLRNYIIDQTNVYEGAQCRKVRPFQGFKRKAIIVVPPDDVYKSRLEERLKTSKSVHQDAILEMKANFHIPVAGAPPGREDSFDEIFFVELPKSEAVNLIAQYNAEGQVKFKRISKQYHKRELKAKQRVVDLEMRAQRRGGRGRGRGGGRGVGRGTARGGIKRDFQGSLMPWNGGNSTAPDNRYDNMAVNEGNTNMRGAPNDMRNQNKGGWMQGANRGSQNFQGNPMMGNQQPNMVGNSPMMSPQVSNMMGPMGNQPSNIMGNQPANMMGNQPSNMMGGPPSNMMGGPPSNMMVNQSSNMMGNPPSNMMGGPMQQQSSDMMTQMTQAVQQSMMQAFNQQQQMMDTGGGSIIAGGAMGGGSMGGGSMGGGHMGGGSMGGGPMGSGPMRGVPMGGVPMGGGPMGGGPMGGGPMGGGPMGGGPMGGGPMGGGIIGGGPMGGGPMGGSGVIGGPMSGSGVMAGNGVFNQMGMGVNMNQQNMGWNQQQGFGDGNNMTMNMNTGWDQSGGNMMGQNMQQQQQQQGYNAGYNQGYGGGY